MAVINFPDSPSDGATQTVGGITYTYSSSKGYWTAAASSGGGGGGGASVTTDDSAPSSPSDGDLWYDTDDGGMFVYYEDTDSSQWVEVIGSQGATGAAGAAGADGGAGVASVYATIDLLPLTGNTQGDMAHVTANNTLYFWNGSGWYKIALINTNPSISGVSSSYDLESDGTATTVTMTATDPEGLPITYSIASDTSGNIATVSQGTGASRNVFTITPSTNSAYAGSFTLTFRASDGVNIATAPATFTLQFIVQNSKYTTALVTTSGSAGTNTTFTDSSSNSHTVTASGNATQTTFSPYRHAGYSALIGTSDAVDYLSVAQSASINGLYSVDHTIEFWFNKQSERTQNYILTKGGQTTREWGISVTSTGVRVYWNTTGSGGAGDTSVFFNGTIDLYKWYHLAVTFDSTTNTITVYLNGSSLGTGTFTSIYGGNGTLYIGKFMDYGAISHSCHAYIRDLRIVKGTKVYTADFTPPTESLTAITNTSLLACHLPYFADGSTNNHTITPNGANTSIKPFVPYNYQSEYAVGDNGGSLSLDGTGDYLDITTSAANLGTGDFTVECWTYWSADPRSIIYDTRQSNGASGHALFMTSTTHNVVFYDNNATVLTSAGAVKQGIWNHIAVVRNSGTINIFINGKKDTAQVTGNSTNFDAHAFRIGEKTYGGIPNVTGNITDFRISSTPRYTTDFTPATAPLTSDGDTSLLLNMQGAKILDKSQSATSLTLVGNTTASTAQYKYLPTSMYFDGAGDVLHTESNVLNNFGTADFTLEAWIYPTAYTSSGWNTLFSIGNSTNNGGLLIGKNASEEFVIRQYGIADRVSYSTLPSLNTWTHLACVRSNGTSTIYYNGVAVASASDTTNYSSTTPFAHVGNSDHTTYSHYWSGYVEDLRFTPRLARYTANFTPPTAALQG